MFYTTLIKEVEFVTLSMSARECSKTLDRPEVSTSRRYGVTYDYWRILLDTAEQVTNKSAGGNRNP
jgi:hypothetical protein